MLTSESRKFNYSKFVSRYAKTESIFLRRAAEVEQYDSSDDSQTGQRQTVDLVRRH